MYNTYRELPEGAIRQAGRTATDAAAGTPECPQGTRAFRLPSPSRCVLLAVLPPRAVLYLSSDIIFCLYLNEKLSKTFENLHKHW